MSGIPRIDKMEIEGRGFHTNLYAVHGIYSGGREGKSKIQWLRSMIGSPDLISIPGILGPCNLPPFIGEVETSRKRSLINIIFPCYAKKSVQL